jgi:dTDP-L-rhamnose 4-epimerase
MSSRRVLVTGGAGFIGSHLVDALLARGDDVRVLDALVEQVHPRGEPPTYLSPDVELIVGDVRDPAAVAPALRGVDQVVHFAARVGVGQSMYAIHDYVDVNVRGTAVLLECIARQPVGRLLVASSMSVYGEGLYADAFGDHHESVRRSLELLRAGEWDPRGPDGAALTPCPTPESKMPDLGSVYALTKYDQERLCLMLGAAYGVPSVALRFFNVYGPRQALSNPYTGVLAIFAARLLNGRPPLIYEDGLQRRDFVHVSDVVAACLLALESEAATGAVLNVGSGAPRSVLEIASLLAQVMNRPDVRPEVTGKHRVGDVRHCTADITLARSVLGYEPRTPLSRGLSALAANLAGATADDRVAQAGEELAARGLTF